MDLKIKSKFIFNVERIWFEDSVFVTYDKNIITVFDYPNNKIHCSKVSGILETIQITQNVKLIFQDHSTKIIEDLEIKRINENNKFKLLNDHIYFCDKKLFFIEGTYNIRIIERNLKLYRYFLSEDHYIVEEYDLFFIINSFVFNREFFCINKITYSSNYKFGSNGRDFVVCSDRALILNMNKSVEMEHRINDAKITDKNIIVSTIQSGQTLISIFDMDLNTLYNGINIRYFLNTHHGIILKNKECVIHISGTEMNKFKNYGGIDKIFDKNGLNNKKISFTECNNEIHAYVYDTFSIKKIKPYGDTNYSQNGKYLGDVLSYKLFYETINIPETSFSDFFLDTILIITKSCIILGKNNVYCNTGHSLKNVIGCDAKTLTINYLVGENKREHRLYEMAFSILTVEKISYSYLVNYETPLELFIYNLIIQSNINSLRSLLNNLDIDADLIICKLYRKGDEKIRTLLISLLPDKYFENYISSEAMAIIFLCHEFNLRFFIEKCIYEDNEKRILEIYNFYQKNMVNEGKVRVKEILWEMGNMRVLERIGEVDLSEYYFIKEMNKKL